MNNSKIVRIFHVYSDAETGEWIGAPEDTGETVSLEEFYKYLDTPEIHFDTWEKAIDGTSDTETVAIKVINNVDAGK